VYAIMREITRIIVRRVSIETRNERMVEVNSAHLLSELVSFASIFRDIVVPC